MTIGSPLTTLARQGLQAIMYPDIASSPQSPPSPLSGPEPAAPLTRPKILITVERYARAPKHLRLPDAQTEGSVLKNVHGSLADLHYDVSWQELRKLLEGREVWYFAGHGDYEVSKDERVPAWVNHNNERGDEFILEAVSNDAIGLLISEQPQLKLVVLNGCKTQQLAQTLHDCGVPFVVCWETRVNDHAARLFVAEFAAVLQESLRRGDPPAEDTVVDAFNKGRLAIAAPQYSKAKKTRVQRFQEGDPDACAWRDGRMESGYFAAGKPLLLKDEKWGDLHVRITGHLVLAADGEPGRATPCLTLITRDPLIKHHVRRAYAIDIGSEKGVPSTVTLHLRVPKQMDFYPERATPECRRALYASKVELMLAQLDRKVKHAKLEVAVLPQEALCIERVALDKERWPNGLWQRPEEGNVEHAQKARGTTVLGFEGQIFSSAFFSWATAECHAQGGTLRVVDLLLGRGEGASVVRLVITMPGGRAALDALLALFEAKLRCHQLQPQQWKVAMAELKDFADGHFLAQPLPCATAPAHGAFGRCTPSPSLSVLERELSSPPPQLLTPTTPSGAPLVFDNKLVDQHAETLPPAGDGARIRVPARRAPAFSLGPSFADKLELAATPIDSLPASACDAPSTDGSTPGIGGDDNGDHGDDSDVDGSDGDSSDTARGIFRWVSTSLSSKLRSVTPT